MTQTPWFDSDRLILGKAVPLSTPLSITLTPSSLCNFKCTYCMQSAEKGIIAAKGFKQELMPWDTFATCIKQISEFPDKLKKLEFYGMGEPFCNPRLPEMIAYAKSANICKTTSIMTNGALLTHELSDSLLAAGIDELKISLQGLSSEMYKSTSGANVDFDRLIDEISYFNNIKGSCCLYVKIIETALSDEDKTVNRLDSIFSKICDRYSVENLLPLFGDIDYSETDGTARTSMNKVRFTGQGSNPKRHICHFQFYRLIILTDGRVTSCCDPLNSIYWGNIHSSSLVDMWKGKARFNFLKKQLESNEFAHPLCRSCYMPNDLYSEADDLLPYAAEILERMKGQEKLNK